MHYEVAMRLYGWITFVACTAQLTLALLVIFSNSPRIDASNVQRELSREQRPGTLGPAMPAAPGAEPSSLDAQRLAAEKEALTSALQRAENNRSLAARLLGISRRTLYNKLEAHGLL